MGGFYSAVKKGDQLTLSKVDTVNLETGEIRTGTILQQTSFVLENIKRIIEHEGSSVNDVTKIVAYTRDDKYCSEVREICGEYFQVNPNIEISVISDPAAIEAEGHEISTTRDSSFGRFLVKESYLVSVLMDVTATVR